MSREQQLIDALRGAIAVLDQVAATEEGRDAVVKILNIES